MYLHCAETWEAVHVSTVDTRCFSPFFECLEMGLILCVLMESYKRNVNLLDFLRTGTPIDLFIATPKHEHLVSIVNEIACLCVRYTKIQNSFCTWALFQNTTVYEASLCVYLLYLSQQFNLKKSPLLSGTAGCCGQKHWEGGGDKVHVHRHFLLFSSCKYLRRQR